MAGSFASVVGYAYAGTQNLAAVAAAVRLNSNGKIEALDGDGTGGGTWITLCDYVKIDEYSRYQSWYRITIKLDYDTRKYRVAVLGAYNDADLGFRDSAAAAPGLQAIGFAETSGSTLYVDDVYAGDSPYPPGQDLNEYWSESYNHLCIPYGGPMHDRWDVYDWMSCIDRFGNPVNTDTYPTDPIPGSKAPPFKASLPPGWTAAFQPWADIEPQNHYASGRGKMGFSRLKGQYADSPDDPCLHIWSSHGVLRVVSPNIDSGPGIYTLTFRGGVWNLNTADPAMQSLWTEWCSWGYGYTNWCVWDPWNPSQGVLQTLPPFPQYMDWMPVDEYWTWPRTPFAAVNPHPAGEEPGQWHTFTNTFAFGLCPEELVSGYPQADGGRYSGRGYYIGFQVAHSRDESAAGYEWGTLLNVDDITLSKKDPVDVKTARSLPVNTLVEIANMVITNMVLPPDYISGVPKYLDVYLEKPDRSAAILVRAYGDMTAHIFDPNTYPPQFKFQRGDVVRVVGAVSKDDPYYNRVPQPDTRNPVTYISRLVQGSQDLRMPAIIATGGQVALKPVAVPNKSLAPSPYSPGLGTEAMLVTVFGRVNHSSWYYCYVDDGLGLPAGKPDTDPYSTSATGVRIDCRGLVLDPNFWGCPPDGSYIAVTGAYSTEKNAVDHTTVVRVVYPRQANDFVTYWP